MVFRSTYLVLASSFAFYFERMIEDPKRMLLEEDKVPVSKKKYQITIQGQKQNS